MQMHQQQRDSQKSSSSSNEIIDSSGESQVTPLSLIHNNRFLPFNLITNRKPILKYKKCIEHMQYSNCLVTYLDHPSATFIQLSEDGPAFQRMHQDMNRYYLNKQSATFFEIGDFCVAYSAKYLEFYRARIIKKDHIYNRCLVVFVDFGNSEWVNRKAIHPLLAEFTKLKIQSIAVTLSHIVPKTNLKTDLAHWDTYAGKQCTRKVRRLLIKPDDEPFLFVSVTFLSNETWWPLPFVDIKLDGQDLAEILHKDGLARLTRNNKDLKAIYPNFGTHMDEYLVFGIQLSENHYPTLC